MVIVEVNNLGINNSTQAQQELSRRFREIQDVSFKIAKLTATFGTTENPNILD